MISRITNPCAVCRLIAAALVFWSLSLSAADNATVAAAAKRPRSVFTDDLQTGKDPFYPDSTRRYPVTRPSTAPSASPIAVNGPIRLKGISGPKQQRLALINNATLAAGEAGDVRAGAQVVRIRCREIRERSVLIEINGTGEVRELTLREGI